MDPMRLITYTVMTAVLGVIAMSGAGFYIGYLAGRGNLEEVKALIAASSSPEHAATLSELLKKDSGDAPAAVDLSPVIEEIRSLSSQVGKLEQAGAHSVSASSDGRLQDELSALKLKLTAASDQYNACRQDVNLLQAKLKEPPSPQTTVSTTQKANAEGSRDPASVVLFDNVQLKRDQNKLYNDVDVALSLQSVTSRSAKVAVNQQSFGIAFGERKIFQHKDVTCELVLMETDLEGSQARLSIACKR
jgi:seryl-tRNA synthetase